MTSRPIGLFGELLFDQFSDDQKILGGAPFNVAWHLQAFDGNPRFVSRVGYDAQGEIIRQIMIAWGMAIDDLQTDSVHPAGAVAITLDHGEPEYVILDRQAYDFISSRQPESPHSFSIIYHGTLALRNPVSKRSLDELLTDYTGKVFIDANLREPWWNQESVRQSLHCADWVKLNDHELMQLSLPHLNQRQAICWFQREYHLDTLIVTCGGLVIDSRNELMQSAQLKTL